MKILHCTKKSNFVVFGIIKILTRIFQSVNPKSSGSRVKSMNAYSLHVKLKDYLRDLNLKTTVQIDSKM